MVLLKNDGILPMRRDTKSIGIIGPNAEKAQIIGGGSATLVPYSRISSCKLISK